MGRPVVARCARVPVVPGLAQRAGEGGRRLGHAVAADRLAPERVLDLGEQLGRRRARRRSTPAAPTRGRGSAMSGWSSSRRAMVGTRNRRVTPLPLGEAEHLGGVEAGEHHVGAAEAGEEVGRAPAVDVEQRDGVQQHVVAGDAVGEGVVHRVEVQRPVREHRALGPPRRARRVEELGRGVLVDRRRRARGARRRPGVEVVGRSGEAGIGERRVAHQRGGPAVGEAGGQLRRRVADVQRHEHARRRAARRSSPRGAGGSCRRRTPPGRRVARRRRRPAAGRARRSGRRRWRR